MGFDYPRNLHFKCERCAICCGDTEKKTRKILLLKLEANRISKKTVKNIATFAQEIEGYEPYVYEMKKTKNEKCIFLEDSVCSIYSMRPLICRFYPFELKAAGNNRYVFNYTNECPCIDHGPELKRSYFDRLFKKSKESMKNA
ncbi:MAG: YkgJ family cysteine cluster protein [Candidatus Bathyarchaeia archaeon]